METRDQYWARNIILEACATAEKLDKDLADRCRQALVIPASPAAPRAAAEKIVRLVDARGVELKGRQACSICGKTLRSDNAKGRCSDAAACKARAKKA